jgi:hypothetical protein
MISSFLLDKFERAWQERGRHAGTGRGEVDDLGDEGSVDRVKVETRVRLLLLLRLHRGRGRG